MAARTPSAALGGDVIVYGLGNVAVAALNFGLFAIYARVLRPEDYGAMSLILTVCAAVSMLGMMGMNNAVQRFFFEDSSEAGQRRVWSTGFVGGVALTLFFAALAVLVFQVVGRREPALAGPAALVALAALVPQTIVIWLQDRARLQFQPARFVWLAIAQTVVAGAAGLFFVAVRGHGIMGFFLGSLVGAAAATALALSTLRGWRPLEFSPAEFRRLVVFGAPFVPAGVAMWASTTVLRWELVHFKDLEAAGIFDVAWKLAAPVWMLNAAVGQAFSPFAFKLRAEDPAYREKLVDWFHLLGAVPLLIVCLLVLFAREVCAVIVPPAYAAAALPCAILAFAFYFSALHQVTALGIAFAQQSRLVALGWTGAAIFGFAAAIPLTKNFGAAGAAWCMVLMYAGLTLFYVRQSQRLHPLPFRFPPIAVQVGVGLAALGVAFVLDRPDVSFGRTGLKLMCLAVLACVVFAGGGINVPRTRAALGRMLGGAKSVP